MSTNPVDRLNAALDGRYRPLRPSLRRSPQHLNTLCLSLH
jgi:hypothetical protein